jgi:hypothetical protein
MMSEPIGITGIWLVKSGVVIVRAEINGNWVDLIKEHEEGPFSHIIEPSGIRKCAALVKPEEKEG